MQASWAAESTRPDLDAITQALQNTSIAFTSVWGDHVTTTKLSAKLGTADAPGAFTGSQFDLISQAWNSPMADQRFGCGELEDVWQYQLHVQRDFPKVDVTFEIFYLQCVAGGAGRVSPKLPARLLPQHWLDAGDPRGRRELRMLQLARLGGQPGHGQRVQGPAHASARSGARSDAHSGALRPRLANQPSRPQLGLRLSLKGTTATDLWCQQVQCAPVYNNVCTSACLR